MSGHGLPDAAHLIVQRAHDLIHAVLGLLGAVSRLPGGVPAVRRRCGQTVEQANQQLIGLSIKLGDARLGRRLGAGCPAARLDLDFSISRALPLHAGARVERLLLFAFERFDLFLELVDVRLHRTHLLLTQHCTLLRLGFPSAQIVVFLLRLFELVAQLVHFLQLGVELINRRAQCRAISLQAFGFFARGVQLLLQPAALPGSLFDISKHIILAETADYRTAKAHSARSIPSRGLDF